MNSTGRNIHIVCEQLKVKRSIQAEILKTNLV